MPTTKDLKTRISKTKKDIQKLESKLLKDTRLLFDKSIKEIFDNNEKLTSFAWTQYTPGWNDGDPCLFSANTEYVYLNGAEEAYGFWEVENLYKNVLNKNKVIKKLKEENENISKDQKWQIESNERKIKEIEETSVDDVEWKAKALKKMNFP